MLELSIGTANNFYEHWAKKAEEFRIETGEDWRLATLLSIRGSNKTGFRILRATVSQSELIEELKKLVPIYLPTSSFNRGENPNSIYISWFMARLNKEKTHLDFRCEASVMLSKQKYFSRVRDTKTKEGQTLVPAAKGEWDGHKCLNPKSEKVSFRKKRREALFFPDGTLLENKKISDMGQHLERKLRKLFE